MPLLGRPNPPASGPGSGIGIPDMFLTALGTLAEDPNPVTGFE